MPGPITILSWNIQIFGGQKMHKLTSGFPLVPSEIFKFIALVAAGLPSPPDIVAIMEVNANSANMILGYLVSAFNNVFSCTTWQGQYADRQISPKAESYIILWNNSNANRIKLYNDPVTSNFFCLSGRVSTKLLQQTFDPTNANKFFVTNLAQDPDIKKLFAGQNNKYDWVLLANQWKEIQKLYAPGNVTTPISILPAIAANKVLTTPADQIKLQNILYRHMPVLFPDATERFPYIAHFLVDPSDTNPIKPLTAAILHAPYNTNPVTAINNLGQLNELNNLATNRVMMGDFNVPVNSTTTGYAYGFVQDVTTSKFTYEILWGALKQLVTVFTPLTTAPVSMTAVLNPANPPSTSVAATYYDPTVTPSPLPTQYLSSAYDNLFFGADTSGTLTVVGSGASDLIGAMIPPSPTATAVAQLAMQVFMEGNARVVALKYATGSTKKKKITPGNPNLMACLKAMNCDTATPPSYNNPSNTAEAQIVYRFAISDHIPIWVQLN